MFSYDIHMWLFIIGFGIIVFIAARWFISWLIKLRKFGRNEDIDTGTSEDVWDFGGLYPFPTAAAATTIVSDSAADTGAGTGLQQARVFGLDSNFLEIQEDVTLNGLTPVALSNQYLRVFRIFGLVWGSSGLNQGNVDVLHSPTVLARVTVNPRCYECGCSIFKTEEFKRDDIYRCSYCRRLYRLFPDGSFFRVFGVPPAIKGGNHESKHNH